MQTHAYAKLKRTLGSETFRMYYTYVCTVEVKKKNLQNLSQNIINPQRACAARVTVLGSCVCLSVRSILATTSKSKLRKRYPTLHRDKTKRIKLAIFLKMLRSKVMASFAHFVGIRRSCRALQFILGLFSSS